MDKIQLKLNQIWNKNESITTTASDRTDNETETIPMSSFFLPKPTVDAVYAFFSIFRQFFSL